MRTLIATSIAVFSWITSALGAGPLVDVPWLKANIGKPGVVILDIRPGHAYYLAGHIPGAVYSDYVKDKWREKNAAGIDGMLPPPERIGALIGRLGIDNDTHVVLVPEGRNAQDMGTATRIYWTFKVVGHDKVSILDGGFLAWIRDVDQSKRPINPLETANVLPKPKAFTVNVRREMLIDKSDVQKAITAGHVLVDNRPQDFYLGLTQSPAAKGPGTIPGAQSIPESWLTANNGGTFRTKAQLAAIYKAANVPTSGDQITFCNTGHWASLGWFVSSEIIGNKSVRMYDGSMAEWTSDKSLPVEVKINAK